MSASDRRAYRDRDTLRAFAQEITNSFLEERVPDTDGLEQLLVRHGLLVEVPARESCGLGCTCYSLAAFPTVCLRRSRVLTGNRTDPEASDTRDGLEK